MAKVTDIDEAFREHIESEWSAKELLNHLDICWTDLHEHVITERDWQTERDSFCDQELSVCDECAEHFDSPADTIHVCTTDIDANYCEDCHKRLSAEGRI